MAEKKAYARKREEVKPYIFDSPDHRAIRIMLSPERDNTMPGMAIGMVEMPGGFEAPPHQHESTQEAWYFIEGKGQIRIGDEVIDVEPGMVVASPPKTPHALINPGPGLLRAIFIFTPDGPEKFQIME